MSRTLAAASLLIALAASLAAQEVGEPVRFPNPAPTLRPLSEPGQDVVVYDSGRSAKVAADWDTVLFQGVSPDADARFQAQRETAKGWTEWREAQVSRRANGRFWAKARFPESGPGAVRVRAVAPSVSGARLKIFSVEVFHSADVEAKPGVRLQQEAPSAESAFPGLIGRAAWGAKPSKEPFEPHSPVKITLHHTDTPQTWTLAESEEEVRFIQEFHQRGRGWNDIGYHFLVDASGHVFEGRPEGVIGAHTQYNNTGNVGVALLGTHHPPKNDAVTPLEENAVAAVGRYLVAKYGIDPNSLKGHRDYKETDCPGDVAYAKLGELRRLFAQQPPLAGLGVIRPERLPLPARQPSFDGVSR